MDKRKKKSKQVKRKRRRCSYMLLYITLGFFAVITLIVLSLTILFPIEKIEVKGNSIYTSEQIEQASGIELGKNLFMANLKNIDNSICSTLPYIEKVEAKRSFPSAITLKVTQAKAYAQVESNGKFYIIDKDGKCLNVSNEVKSGVPIVRGSKISDITAGNNIEFNGENGDNKYKLLVTLLSSFEEYKLTNITVINISDSQDLWATCKDKVVLLFGSSGNLDLKIKSAVTTMKLRESNDQTGTLNLSRLPNNKNQTSFIPTELTEKQVSVVKN